MAKTLDEAGVKRLIQEIKGANKNLNAPIPISTENTPESKAQNVKNIADYVEKVKAAGVDTTKSFRLTLEIDGYPVEGSYDIQYSYACGLQITDDGYALLYNIDVTTGEVFTPCEIVTARSIQKVTSSMLDKGARKPIIITGDMTEVDEETYQKLLSDDVDVIANFGEGIFIESQAKVNMGDTLDLIFGYSQFDESNGAITTFTISINTSAPHTLTLAVMGLCEPVSKSTLNPVLQEIDLIGTDADRKAKLDQFETDWKALTGASDLVGARFVGKFGITDGIERNVTGIMTYCAGDTATGANDNCFYGICNGYSLGEQKSQIAVKVSCTDGSLTITPLFSHLEAITIKTNNSTASKVANVAAIKAYVDNLTALGVDTTKGFLIPINVEGQGAGFISRLSGTDSYMGIMTSYGIPTFGIAVSVAGEYYSYRFQTDSDNSLTTTSKQIVGAINEVNALVEKKADKSLNAKSLEAITIYTDNTPEHMQANLDNIAAYEANLQALGVDTTKGCTIPIVCSPIKYCGILFGRGDDYYEGVCNSHSTRVTLGVAINVDGSFYATNNLNTISEYKDLTTIAKRIIPAINEVNALVEKKADKTLNAKSLEAITIYTDNTPEHMQANLDNIAAYKANLQALGVDTTKGYMIPITASGRNGFLSTRRGDYPYTGYAATNSSVVDFYNILILGTGQYHYTKIQVEDSADLHTTSKQIVGAINEVNANAVHSDKLVPTLEAITIRIGNTPETKAANVAAIKAYVDNLIALGVDVTKGYMIPVKLDNGYHGFIMGTDANGGHTGIIKRGTYNYGGGWIFIDKIGTYQYLECLTLGSYDNLTTTAKTIVPAINEVNALAKGYSTIFTPIELTTETAQNKTAIDARVAAFTAQGISLTNGCCIPVTYKGVYAGNISLINGDWYGLLVKNTNNPADNINIKLSADGTITEGNSAQ